MCSRAFRQWFPRGLEDLAREPLPTNARGLGRSRDQCPVVGPTRPLKPFYHEGLEQPNPVGRSGRCAKQ